MVFKNMVFTDMIFTNMVFTNMVLINYSFDMVLTNMVIKEIARSLGLTFNLFSFYTYFEKKTLRTLL